MVCWDVIVWGDPCGLDQSGNTVIPSLAVLDNGLPASVLISGSNFGAPTAPLLVTYTSGLCMCVRMCVCFVWLLRVRVCVRVATMCPDVVAVCSHASSVDAVQPFPIRTRSR